MDNQLINSISELVESACRSESNTFGYTIWSYHIIHVVRIAKELADEYGAEKEIVTLAALLHDYAGIKDRTKIKDHHIHGAEEAENILAGYKYPQGAYSSD